MPVIRGVSADYGLIKEPGSMARMTGPECVACMEAARLSNREVARQLMMARDHSVRNWTNDACPPPANVVRWLRGLAAAHIAADQAWPAPSPSDGE